MLSLLSFPQGSTITFTSQGGLPVTGDALGNLNLPLKIRFSKAFKGKELVFKNNADQQKFNATQVLGTGDLTFHANDPFDYVLESDMKTNPGAHTIPSSEILLSFAGKDFVLKLAPNGAVADNGAGGTAAESCTGTTKPDDYVAGYVAYDVPVLLDKQTDVRLKLKILGAYGINSSNIGSNPYLNELFGNLYGRGLPEGGFGGLIGNLGNTDVTYFAAGIARFLAERTKEELNEAFFTKMQAQLNACPELKTLFPQTTSFLNITESYSYASVIQVLKEAFETDVQNLPINLYQVKSLTEADCDASVLKSNPLADCRERMKKLHEFFESRDGRWIGLGLFTVKEAVQSSNPAELLKSISASDELAGITRFSSDNALYTNYNLASSIRLSNLISQSLVSKEDQQIWITPKELNALVKTQASVKAYLGLLLAEEEQNNSVLIRFYQSDHTLISFGDFLRKQYDSFNSFGSQVSSLIRYSHNAFDAANNAVKKMQAATDKAAEADPQALYNYYRTVTATLKPIAHSALLETLSGQKDIGTEYDKTASYLNPSVDIAYHLATKKYSAAIYDATILLNYLKPADSRFKPVTSAFTKYGILISTVANAQSSDEVKQALEASVLPAGSYSIKRKTNWSMSINSYVGAYWSYADNDKSLPPFGLSAPIGFTISKGFSKSGKAGGLSVNLQIIDVGALVNYYLLKGDTASLPNDFKVKLSNIFAPGFNVCYNIPKTPLSIAWGGQYIPTLYRYEQISGRNQLVSTSTFRMQASLLVDIPLYNLKVWDFKR